METPTKERQLVLNRIKCLECEEVLTSYHRDDFQSCSCPNKSHTDGGLSYMIYGGMDMSRIEVLSVYLDDDYETVRKSFHWGTYGKESKGPLKFLRLDTMSNNHILKILALLTGKMPKWIEELFEQELKYRKENKIRVSEKV